MYIEENLKNLRKQHKWTQEEVAEMINISPQSVSKWERGDTLPDITMLPTLANLYAVSIDSIVGMDKINGDEARAKIFAAAHEHLRKRETAAAVSFLENALQTFPSDEEIMSKLALALALCENSENLENSENAENLANSENSQNNLQKAAKLCERVLSANPTAKVRHTTSAAISFVYLKLGEREKAEKAAKNLTPIRESRESILAELAENGENSEKSANIDNYLRFLALSEENAKTKLTIELGANMVATCTEHNLTDKIAVLRAEIESIKAVKSLKILPLINIRDMVELPPNRVRISHYGDILLDSDFADSAVAAAEIMAIIGKIAKIG
ncbi:MAG: helix-turn-helix domain-containing protein [Defluviitaleaceae bacterium]|nr:helix-turn-helix domain-containing protein [Defluviitaleaceae bacterium]